jgi:hypothetical protein
MSKLAINQLPQNWVYRTAAPYQKIDQVEVPKYYKRLERMVMNNQISPYENLLAVKLHSMGYDTVSQYAIPDMDNGNIFYWYYDLYVPKRDLLIEVQGKTHNDKFQLGQDARKRSLARMQGFNFKEIRNSDIAFKSEVERLLR